MTLRLLPLVVFGLPGCGESAVSPGIEAGRVTIAAVELAPDDPTAASSLCGSLQDANSADLCRIAVAFSLHETSTQLAAVCQDLTREPWTQECAFITVDNALRWNTPLEHIDACAELDPRWAPHCVEHGFHAWELGYQGDGGFPNWFSADGLEAQLAAVRGAVPQDSEQLRAFEEEMRRLAGVRQVEAEVARWW